MLEYSFGLVWKSLTETDLIRKPSFSSHPPTAQTVGPVPTPTRVYLNLFSHASDNKKHKVPFKLTLSELSLSLVRAHPSAEYWTRHDVSLKSGPLAGPPPPGLR
jgi:hypothetical protein